MLATRYPYSREGTTLNIESCTKDLDVHPTLLLDIPKFGIHIIYIVIMLDSFLKYDMYEVVWVEL